MEEERLYGKTREQHYREEAERMRQEGKEVTIEVRPEGEFFKMRVLGKASGELHRRVSKIPLE
jgi:hypothetical protein